MFKEDNYPKLYASGFICPFCGLYAEQTWQIVFTQKDLTLVLSTCQECNRYLLWSNERVLEPNVLLSEPMHHMTPDVCKGYYERSMRMLYVDLDVAYAYLKHAFYLFVVEYLGSPADTVNQSVEKWKEQGLGAYSLWAEIERLGFLANLNKRIEIFSLSHQDPELIKKGFRLFNNLIEEFIANPSQLINFFAHQDNPQEKSVDPDFYER